MISLFKYILLFFITSFIKLIYFINLSKLTQFNFTECLREVVKLLNFYHDYVVLVFTIAIIFVKFVAYSYTLEFL